MQTSKEHDNHGGAADLLHAEYARIFQLCRIYQQALESDATAGRMRAAHDLCRLISICMLVEEEVLYPEALKVDQALVFDMLLAQEEITGCITAIRALDPEDMDYDVEMLRLIDAVKNHIKQSEHSMLPLIEQALPAASLQPLAADLVQHRLLLETLASGKAAQRVAAVAGTQHHWHAPSGAAPEFIEHKAAA